MKRIRSNWTAKEDTLLRDLVQNEMENSRPLFWRELAKHIPGRSDKDCRKRWWNGLAGDAVKGPWSQQEDKRLIQAVCKHGTNWNQVAGVVGSRCADQCSRRWSQVFNPEINCCDWTTQEDERLLYAVLSYGTNWSTIAASHTPQRPALALENRYLQLQLRHVNSRSYMECPSVKPASSPSTEAVNNTERKKNIQAQGFNGNGHAEDEERDGEGEEGADEEGGERSEGEEEVEKDGYGCSARSLSENKSSLGPHELSSKAAPPGNSNLTKTQDVWATYNGAPPSKIQPNHETPRTTGEQWIGGIMDQTTCVRTSAQLYSGEGFLNAPPHGSGADVTMSFAEHDDNAMNIDFGDFQGTLYPESDIPNNQNALLADRLTPVASFPHLDGVTPSTASLKDGNPPMREASIGTMTSESALYQVSIDVSCTAEQLSNILTLLANTGSAVNVKIDTH